MIRRSLILAVALLLALPAHAGMIRPDDAERARLKVLLQREEVRVELQKHGILPQEAAARVDAMTPAEVQSLAGRIDAVVAGGQSTQNLLLVIIIVLLIIIAL
ncbi:MAG TPA: PA2779 family protein [Burkholderiales bacterium]|nr:PA2779 family protein [Burkholderiales bacterium]